MQHPVPAAHSTRITPVFASSASDNADFGPLAQRSNTQQVHGDEANIDVSSIHASLKRLEHHIGRMTGKASPDSLSFDPTVTGEAQEIQLRVRTLERQLAAKTQVSKTTPASTPDAIPQQEPRLRILPDKMKVFGPSHWVHSLSMVRTPYVQLSGGC